MATNNSSTVQQKQALARGGAVAGCAKVEHKLHKDIGSRFKKELTEDKIPGICVHRDPACSYATNGDEGALLQLGGYVEMTRDTRHCCVDMLVTIADQVRVIVEIEEANIKPTQICGKFLTAALSKYYTVRARQTPIEIKGPVLFIQVVRTEGLQKNSKKMPQLVRLRDAIKNLPQQIDSPITEYILCCGEKTEIMALPGKVLNWLNESPSRIQVAKQ